MPAKLRQILDGIRKQLGQLTATQRLLIGSVGVIMVMTLFVVSQYAGRSDMAELKIGGSPDEQDRARLSLVNAGIDAESGPGGTLLVPVNSQRAAIAHLAQSGELPADSSVLFDNLLEKQSWNISKAQSEQLAQIALQNELARVLRGFEEVRDATVIIDAPEPRGLGRAVRRPTASATIFTSSGRALSQDIVDATASLVAGAKAGLEIEQVRVIDGSTGRQRKASDPSQRASSAYMEHALYVENQTREKLSDLLAYIPGVIIAVTAQVDVTNQTEQRTEYLPVSEGSVSLLASEQSESLSQKQAKRAAVPGVQSNQTADITRSSSSDGTSTDETSDNTSFDNAIGSSVRRTVDPRGMPTMLAVSVNVPRSYIASLLKRGAGEDGEEAAVSDDDILDKLQEVIPQIRSSILPHVKTMTLSGKLSDEQIEEQISVSMIPVDVPMGPREPAQAGFMGLGGDSMAMGDLIDKVVLAGLAGVAMLMMLMLVKKSGKKHDLPSAQELVGVPPALQAANDLVGEAEESEAAMPGIEVDDESVRQEKLLEQVMELMKQKPEASALQLNRWIEVHE